MNVSTAPPRNHAAVPGAHGSWSAGTHVGMLTHKSAYRTSKQVKPSMHQCLPSVEWIGYRAVGDVEYLVNSHAVKAGSSAAGWISASSASH